jgi:hypothetical protein
MRDVAAFQSGITQLVPTLETLLVASVVLGLLTQAVLQTTKDLFPLRYYLQRRWILKWLAERSGGRQAQLDMVLLATSGDAMAFYSLPIGQLCGQLNAAARAALEDPFRYPAFIGVFAWTANPADLEKFLSGPPPLPFSEGMSDEDRVRIQGYAQSRNRIAHQVERSVDGLQILIGERWKLWLQTSAFLLSLAFAFAGVRASYWRARDAILVGLLAGYLAPIVRDILAKIQQRGE